MLSKLLTRASRPMVRSMPPTYRVVNKGARLGAAAALPALQWGARAFSTTEKDDKSVDATPEVVEAEPVEEGDDVFVEEDEAVDEDSHVDVGTESATGSGEKQAFRAETRRILDIVANSLYTDKEVFLREIISNASDALEKARYLQMAKEGLAESDNDLEIRVFVNEKNNTLIIQDFGIGMSKEELVENLGTIARSGTLGFKEAADQGDASNMIGQFGVGFYSVFMVSDKVEVYSLSGKTGEDAAPQAHYWSSDGTGEFELAPAEGVSRGTKIIIHLKQSEKQYAIKHIVEGVVKKYSNFVGFPIYLNGNKVNTVQALWAQSKDAANDEQHLEFYRYIANAYDTPFFRMHFNTDAPIAIQALFYFPERHAEKYGMGRAEPGVSLYCRKVLIQHKCAAILPEWLRFLKGVVDSEDIPLNISRENMQDSNLIDRMKNVLTKRVIKFLVEQAKKDKPAYLKFYEEFSNFLKEGVCSDFNHKGDIAALLHFDTSLGEKEPSSLDDYISRMPVDQNEIYYLCAPNREFALSSPYYESFDAAGVEVMFMYNPIDDFVVKNLEKFNKRKLVSIESANAAPKKVEGEEKQEESEEEKKEQEDHSKELVDFFKSALNDRVSTVKATSRLSNSPAIVVDHESAAVRRMMKMVDATGSQELSKQKLEVNPKHPTMVKLVALAKSNPELATLVAEQIYDNALIAADILDNPRTMLSRLNKIMEHACK